MRKLYIIGIATIAMLILAACKDKVIFLEVDFPVQETAEVGETVELKAIVTYDGKPVKDADEVLFEVWEKNDRENGEMLEATNHKDGTYTVEVTFDHDGIFETYAHTTARDMHVMPKKEIVVGEGGEYDDEEDIVFDTDGFDMYLESVDVVNVNDDVELTTFITLHDEAYENLNVRYEIWNDSMGEARDWVDTEESEAGQYKAIYQFLEAEKYTIQIHVEDDEDLHEHVEYEIEVE